ncbi:MAG: hypothetical protein WAW39_17650 [Prosthecobacter sp.]|uniref:hypothetical protein n=1 Tax=Prosthecobacter sp. TaxID=1965333 RepID=UPI003BAE7997
MISSLPPEEFLNWLTQRVSRREALDCDVPEQKALYEPIYDEDPDDPVRLMRKCISRQPVQSFQTFSGFRGSGKTTELFRLRHCLRQDGCLVFYTDALKYLSPADTVDIADMLLVIAGAFNDQLIDQGYGDDMKESWWSRAWHYLKTTTVDVTGLEAGGDIAGAEAKLKAALQTSPSFRQEVNKALVHRIRELKNKVDEFFAENIQRVRKSAKVKKDVKIVFMFDGLEQIQGTRSNENDVVDSITRLFANSREMLEIPSVHLVYTVPPWLKFVIPGFQTRLIPTVKLWKKKDRARNGAGHATMLSILKLRFTDEGFERFFGPLTKKGSHHLADELIEHSGGHFRDLLRLTEEAILRCDDVPVTKESINHAIASIRRNFLPISREDALILREIAEHRDAIPQTTSPAEVSRLARFLNTHVVLYFINGDEWYDLHPLIRDEVYEITKRAAAIATHTESGESA